MNRFRELLKTRQLSIRLEGEDPTSLPRSALAVCSFLLDEKTGPTVRECVNKFLEEGCGEDRCGLPEHGDLLMMRQPHLSLDTIFTNNIMLMNEKMCKQWEVNTHPMCVYCSGFLCFEGGSSWFPFTSQALYTVASILRSLPLAKPVICEIGFNAGHSALQFLTAFPTAHIISFDLAEHTYTLAGHRALQELWAGYDSQGVSEYSFVGCCFAHLPEVKNFACFCPA